MFLNSHKAVKVRFQPFQTQTDEGSILPGLKKGLRPAAAPSSDHSCAPKGPLGHLEK